MILFAPRNLGKSRKGEILIVVHEAGLEPASFSTL
jgi:hypothetical protein